LVSDIRAHLALSRERQRIVNLVVVASAVDDLICAKWDVKHCSLTHSRDCRCKYK